MRKNRTSTEKKVPQLFTLFACEFLFFLGYEKITILNASMIFYQISLIINLNISEHRQNYHINQKKLLPYLRSVFVVCDIYRIRDIRQRIGMNRMERWVRVFVYNKFQYSALPVFSLTLAEICIIRCVKNLIKFGHIILEKCLDKRWSLHTRSNQTWKSLEIITTVYSILYVRVFMLMRFSQNLIDTVEEN